jgi:hypothetical protein
MHTGGLFYGVQRFNEPQKNAIIRLNPGSFGECTLHYHSVKRRRMNAPSLPPPMPFLSACSSFYILCREHLQVGNRLG